MGGDRVATLAALALALTARVASADAEPVRVDLHGPPGCPDREQLWSEVHLRTPRVRLANSDEPARRSLIVTLRPGGRAFEGELVLTDAAGHATRRHLSGETCGAVVSSLALVAALALDPKASTGSIPAVRPAPAAPLQEPAPPPLPPPAAPMPSHPTVATIAVAPPVAERVPAVSREPPSRLRVAAGLHAGVLGLDAPGLVADGDLFADLTLERPGLLSPSFRVSVHRTLETSLRGTAASSVGTGTFAWTFGRAEGCPLRVRLFTGFAALPCALVDVGAVHADGAVNSVEASSETRAWATVGGHARLEWLRELSRGWGLMLEVEGGALVPLVRQTFYFRPSTDVYTAPVVAGLASFGAGVRFP